MFSSLSLAKIVLHKKNLLSSLSIYPLSLIRFISSDSITTQHNSFTISYLINSCGLSQEKALSISKKVHFKSSTKPDSVLTLFRDNGFSDSQISKIVVQLPYLLLSSVDKRLKPKFDFFNSKGLSGADLAKVLCRCGTVLGCSLEKTIIPNFDSLKRIFQTDEKVVSVLKRSMNVVATYKTIESNIAILLDHGVPMSNIQKLLVFQPRLLSINTFRFSEHVEDVKKMKFDPSQYRFLVAVHALGAMSRSSLEAKFEVYKRCGWSEDEVQLAFRNYPCCMMLSEENIMSSMDFIVNKMGYNASSIAKRSIILQYSLERRIIPRCSVIQVLIKNGLVKNLPELREVLKVTEDVFLKRFVTKFEKTVPELLNVYKRESRG